MEYQSDHLVHLNTLKVTRPTSKTTIDFTSVYMSQVSETESLFLRFSNLELLVSFSTFG